jgi:hypothetical protein
VRQPGKQQDQRQRHGDEQAGGGRALVVMIDDAARQLGDQRREQHEQHDVERNRAGGRQRDFVLHRELVEEGQRQHAEDVVQHRRADDDLRLVRVALAEVVEHPHRDADAGRGQRAADEQRYQVVEAEAPAAHRVAEHKGQHETDQRHHDGLDAGLGEAEQVGVHADLEQQQDDADFRQQLHRLVRRNPAEQRWPHQQASQQFADHRGDAVPPGNLREQPRGDKDDGEIKKELVEFHAACPAS